MGDHVMEDYMDDLREDARKVAEAGGEGEWPVFEVEQDSAQQWRWHLKAANGEIVAQGEGHGREEDAREAIRAVRRLAVLAEIPEA